MYPSLLRPVLIDKPAAARTRVAMDNLIPMTYAAQNRDEKGPIVKSERLGGLLNYYYRESDNEKGKEELRAA